MSVGHAKTYKKHPIPKRDADTFELVMIFSRNKNCPHCGFDSVVRSHRRLLEKLLLRAFKLTPFRCHGCNSRFYVPARVIDTIQESNSSMVTSRT
jgi:hypothetical protein